MRTRAKFTVGVTAVALAVSVGGGVAAMAATNGPQQTQSPAVKTSVRAAVTAPIDTSTEAKFTAITPCRIADTRVAGGAVTSGSPRSFVAATSSSLAAQGGNAAGCGIPASAVAIQANVVAVGATSSGYLKVYPFGATVPAASFLNFHDSRAVANGGTITLDATGAKHFTVLASHTTQVVVDVSGYFVKPIWAHVSSDGSLIGGSRVSSVTRAAIGNFEVDFDRDVSNCAYAVTPIPDDIAEAAAEPVANDPDGVLVVFGDASNQTTVDAEFYLTVTC
jgi:hypothetical protein